MASSENATNLLKPLTDCCIANKFFSQFFTIHCPTAYSELIATSLSWPYGWKVATAEISRHTIQVGFSSLRGLFYSCKYL